MEALAWGKLVLTFWCKLMTPSDVFQGLFSKLRYLFPTNILINLYYSVIFSHLIYCIEIWSNATKENLNTLLVLQNKILRIITFSPFDASATPLYKQFSILNIYLLYKHRLGVLMYQ